MLKVLLCFIFLCLNFPTLEARSIVVPKKKTATKYFLTLKNLSNQHLSLYESEVPEFEISEYLEGDFSLHISFQDKWGRVIETPEQKIISFKSRSKLPSTDSKKVDLKLDTKDIVIVPYMAYFSISSTTNPTVSSSKIASAASSASGVKISFRFFEHKKWELELDHLRSFDENKKLQNTELQLFYSSLALSLYNVPIIISPGLNLSHTEASIASKYQDEIITFNSEASSVFGMFKASVSKTFNKILIFTNAHMGTNLYIFRYGLSQSFSYLLRPNVDLGLMGDFAKFANGNNQGKVEGSILKLGINININL